MAPFRLLLLAAPLTLLPAALGQRTVSIDKKIPTNAHACIDDCLMRPYHSDPDIGAALQCGDPYEDECYCATVTASASVASRHINECASSHCAAGDMTRDISSMRAIYASYCIAAGFTQPIVSAWYTAGDGPDDSAPETTAAEATTTSEEDKPTSTSTSKTAFKETSNKDEGGDNGDDDVDPDDFAAPFRASPGGDQTTEVTLVTSTNEPEDDEDAASRVVKVTSTVYRKSEASSASGSDDNDGPMLSKAALGAILGVGIPFVLAVVGVVVWIILRQGKKRQQQQQQENGSSMAENQDSSTAPPANRIDRKPVAISTVSDVKTELSGQSVSRELSGREIHPFPPNDPSPPVAVPGQHEMLAATTRPHEMGHADPRYELQ